MVGAFYTSYMPTSPSFVTKTLCVSILLGFLNHTLLSSTPHPLRRSMHTNENSSPLLISNAMRAVQDIGGVLLSSSGGYSKIVGVGKRIGVRTDTVDFNVGIRFDVPNTGFVFLNVGFRPSNIVAQLAPARVCFPWFLTHLPFSRPRSSEG